MKTFGLARVNSHIQAKGTGLEFQTKKMSQYAELHDLELIKVIQDVASGALETRDGIEEIKSEVKNGNIALTAECVGHSTWDMVKRYAKSMIDDNVQTNLNIL